MENLQVQKPVNSESSTDLAEKLYLYDAAQIKKISQQFKPLVNHRAGKLVKIAHEKEKEIFHSVNRFEPKINRKSELIANKNLDRLELTCRNVSARNISRQNSKEKFADAEVVLNKLTINPKLTVRSQKSLTRSRSTKGGQR